MNNDSKKDKEYLKDMKKDCKEGQWTAAETNARIKSYCNPNDFGKEHVSNNLRSNSASSSKKPTNSK